MAHKAKPKLKPGLTQQTKTNPKIKITQRKTKVTEKTTKTTPQNENKNLPLCSFTESIILVLSPRLAEKGPGPSQKPQTDENETTKAPLVIVHKRGKKRVNTDIIGAKSLTAWKKSSGRSKSWANCRRRKLSQGDLELLVESRTRSVVFGWRISSAVTPSSFLRSQRLSINSEPTRKRSSTTRSSRHLAVTYDREVPPPRGRPVWGWVKRQGNEYRAEWGFLRLTINREVVSLTREAYITAINLPTPNKVSERETNSNAGKIQRLLVLRLLRNHSHADVYLVQNPNAPFELYDAHAFLNVDLSGNRATFSKRKMKHLRGSHDFVFEILQGERTIIVMEPESKAKEFHLKITQIDFPSLPDTVPKSAKIRPKKNIGRLSYAAVVGRKRLSNRPLDSNHRAYKAWEDRNGRGKKKAKIKLESALSRKSEVSQLERKVEDFTGWVMVDRRKPPSIAHRSRG